MSVELRRRQFRRALKWSAALFAGYLFVTYQVVTYGFLTKVDYYFWKKDHPEFSGITEFIILRLDDLGRRWVSAVVLLAVVIYIKKRYNTWRPVNLALLIFLANNLIVAAFKIGLGRTKPRLGFDLLNAGGMSYPSGHETNVIATWGIIAYLLYRYAHIDRYQGRLASALVALFSVTVFVVSLVRNTHWFSDLLGGLLLGGGLLVLTIAIDRYFPSKSQPQ